jgi:hypothetical protein
LIHRCLVPMVGIPETEDPKGVPGVPPTTLNVLQTNAVLCTPLRISSARGCCWKRAWLYLAARSTRGTSHTQTRQPRKRGVRRRRIRAGVEVLRREPGARMADGLQPYHTNLPGGAGPSSARARQDGTGSAALWGSSRPARGYGLASPTSQARRARPYRSCSRRGTATRGSGLGKKGSRLVLGSLVPVLWRTESVCSTLGPSFLPLFTQRRRSMEFSEVRVRKGRDPQRLPIPKERLA